MSETQYRIVGQDGSFKPVDNLEATQAADSHRFAWVDLLDPALEDLQRVGEAFGLHPLAIEDTFDAHIRGKIEPYETFWFIVAHAFTPETTDDLKTTEIAILAGERFVVTVRHTPTLSIDEIERRWATLTALRRDSGAFVYTILDTVVDDYVPFVSAMEGDLETIESELMEQSRSPWRANNIIPMILEFKNKLQAMRHVVSPMQDVIARISRGDIALFSEDEMIYYRNIGTHVKRVLARIDGLNELVTTALSLNVSIAANRHADISKQLTIIATIFLPLSFITGFFGQNFGWLVNNIAGPREFWWFGIGTEVVAIAILFWLFVRRRWL